MEVICLSVLQRVVKTEPFVNFLFLIISNHALTLKKVSYYKNLCSPYLTFWRLTTYIYICHTAQLISRRCILNIYSTNILTEYFEHAAHSPFFSLSSKCRLFRKAIFFGSCIIHILNTGCAKISKKIPAPKS